MSDMKDQIATTVAAGCSYSSYVQLMKKEFDFSEPLKPIIRMMQLTGTWPKTNPSLKYKITAYASLTILITVNITIFLAFFTSFLLGDTRTAMYAIIIGLAAFHTIVKHTVLNINKTKLFKLLDSLKDPLFTSHKHLNIYAAKKMYSCNRGWTFFVFCIMSTLALITAVPVVGNRISQRMLPVPFPMDLTQQPVIFYILIWTYQAIAALLAAFILPSYDGLIVFFMGIAAAQLKILGEKVMHATDCLSNRSTDLEKYDKLINGKLRGCVIHHIAIERYIKSIEDMYMTSFLIQILVSLIITVFVGFNCIITPIKSVDFGRDVFFFVAVVMELTLFCVPGNEIIRQSEKIRDACYMSEWPECGSSVRRSLFIIMERSKRPITLTAGKFVILSLASLLAVLQSSFSYFTVLRHVYSNSDKQ